MDIKQTMTSGQTIQQAPRWTALKDLAQSFRKAEDVHLETQRLSLRPLTLEDAEFIFELLNDPSFIENIGDKGVRDLEDAKQYLRTGPLASYEQHGLGLLLVEQKASSLPVGICGLLKRETLKDADVGFAFLPRFCGKGYATESAAASVAYGFEELHLPRIVGITSPSNHASGHVLEKIGLRFESECQLTGESETIKLYAVDRSQYFKAEPGSVEP